MAPDALRGRESAQELPPAVGLRVWSVLDEGAEDATLMLYELDDGAAALVFRLHAADDTLVAFELPRAAAAYAAGFLAQASGVVMDPKTLVNEATP